MESLGHEVFTDKILNIVRTHLQYKLTNQPHVFVLFTANNTLFLGSGLTTSIIELPNFKARIHVLQRLPKGRPNTRLLR